MNCITQLYMSYSNGKLPEDTFSHEKVIEIVKGLPGVGFKLTDNGDYDMQNKKLRNVGSPQTNNDATTKSYVDTEVNKTLKLDGSNAMTGALNMDNRKISNLAEGTDNSDAITKHQLETGLAPKADKTELSNYLKRDGTVSVTGNFDFGDNIITKVGNGSQSTDVVNKGYIDTELFSKPNVNQVVLRDGSQDMTGNLNMSQNKITNLKKASGGTDAVNWSQMLEEQRKYLHSTGGTMQGDINLNQNSIYNIKNVSNDTSAVNKAYVDQKVSQAGGSVDLTPYLKKDGSISMTGNFDLGNHRIINIKNATHNQDAVTLKQVNDAFSTISTENNKYTDQKIAESHISTHENRKNVLKYAMDDGEFTEDAGIQDVNLIDFNDMSHKTNKKAFSMKVQRTNDGSSEYKGRFDFNLFKLIRDNFSDHYTVCLETYFQKSPFYDYEFGSTVLSFEALNINIDTGLTVKVNSEYKYLRTILNLSPDGTSKQIQRRLYVNFKSNFDNSSPVLLPIFVLIYGIKDEAKSDLDMTIYDYEKAYEVANNEFQLHIPIDMNDNKITGLSAPTGDNDAVTKKYLTDSVLPSYIWGTTSTNNASCDFLTPYGDFVLKIGEMFIGSIKIFF